MKYFNAAVFAGVSTTAIHYFTVCVGIDRLSVPSWGFSMNMEGNEDHNEQANTVWTDAANFDPGLTPSIPVVSRGLFKGVTGDLFIRWLKDVLGIAIDSQLVFEEVDDFPPMGGRLPVDTNGTRRVFSKRPRPTYLGMYRSGSHTAAVDVVHALDRGSGRDAVQLLGMTHLYNVSKAPPGDAPGASTVVLLANNVMSNVKNSLPKLDGVKFRHKKVRLGGLVTSYDVTDTRLPELKGAKLTFVIVNMSLASYNVSDPLTAAEQCICFFRSNVVGVVAEGAAAPFKTMWLKTHLVHPMNTQFLRAREDLMRQQDLIDMEVYEESCRAQNYRSSMLSDG